MEERIRKIFYDLDNFISYNCTKKYKKRPTAICEDCNMNCLASYVIHKEEEARKKIAKEILQDIASPYYSVGDVYELTRHDIQELATKFGAEVSDE